MGASFARGLSPKGRIAGNRVQYSLASSDSVIQQHIQNLSHFIGVKTSSLQIIRPTLEYAM